MPSFYNNVDQSDCVDDKTSTKNKPILFTFVEKSWNSEFVRSGEQLHCKYVFKEERRGGTVD